MQAVPVPLPISEVVCLRGELITEQDFLENEKFKALCEKSVGSFSLPQFGDDGTPEISEIFDSAKDLKEKLRKTGFNNSNTKALPASSTENRGTTAASPPPNELIPTQEKHQQLRDRIPIITTQVSPNLDGFSASVHHHDSTKECFPLSWSDFLMDDVLETDLKDWKKDQMRPKEEASEEDYKTKTAASIKNRHSSHSKGSREKVQGQSSAKEVRSKSSSKHTSNREIPRGEGGREYRHRPKSRHCERRQRSNTKESVDGRRSMRNRSVAPSEANQEPRKSSRNDVSLDSSIHSCLIPVKRSHSNDRNPGLEAKAHGSQRKSKDLDLSPHSVHVSKDIAQSRRSRGNSRKDVGLDSSIHSSLIPVRRSSPLDKNPGLEAAIRGSQRKIKDLDSTHSAHASKDIAQSRRSHSVLHRRKSRDVDGSNHSIHASKDIEKASKSHYCERRQRSSTKESDDHMRSKSSNAAPLEADVLPILGSNRRSNVESSSPNKRLTRALFCDEPRITSRKDAGLDSSIHSCLISVKRSDSHDENPGKGIRGSQRKSKDLDLSPHSVHVSKDIAQSRRSREDSRKDVGLDSSIHSSPIQVRRSSPHDKNPGKAIRGSQRKSKDLDSSHSIHASKDIAQSGRSHSVLHRRKSRGVDGSSHSIHVSKNTVSGKLVVEKTQMARAIAASS